MTKQQIIHQIRDGVAEYQAMLAEAQREARRLRQCHRLLLAFSRRTRRSQKRLTALLERIEREWPESDASDWWKIGDAN